MRSLGGKPEVNMADVFPNLGAVPRACPTFQRLGGQLLQTEQYTHSPQVVLRFRGLIPENALGYGFLMTTSNVSHGGLRAPILSPQVTDRKGLTYFARQNVMHTCTVSSNYVQWASTDNQLPDSPITLPSPKSPRFSATRVNLILRN